MKKKKTMNLEEIQKPVKHLLKQTDQLLKKRVQSNIPIITKINDTAPITKGKKIRSTLLFLLAGMNGSLPSSPDLSEIAASIEMFHLSSLIHDDVVDKSELRRGELTLHSNLGNNLSVMWGDFLFISAFAALNNLDKKFLMDIILKAARVMVEGQIIEMDNTFNFNIQHDTYYNIINKKTSALFAAVTQIAAAVNNETPNVQKKYYQFGLNFGTIFQVTDDMLDIFSENTGKDRFSDLKEGKVTLPVILLLKENKEDIKTLFSEGNREKLLSLFETYKIKDMCLQEIARYYHQCLEFLNLFPDSAYKKSVLNLLEFIKYRDY
ncbi:MAG: polyprenyl synthetase family protein [Candidatus Aminicenantes bacterium]|nr:MAG: polyprenyl synthetase family protein [Candidatus Aminicenantes bacterium]